MKNKEEFADLYVTSYGSSIGKTDNGHWRKIPEYSVGICPECKEVMRFYSGMTQCEDCGDFIESPEMSI
jgi:hypothetical protein